MDRFTNERHSTTIGTIGLPRLAYYLLLSQTPVNNIFERIASKHTSQRSENSTRLKTIHCDQR